MKTRAHRINRKPALLLLAAAVFGSVGFVTPVTAQTPEFMVVRESGPRDKRVNIVIVGDGYTASEKPKFLAHLKTVADVVVQDEPLTEYADYFNIYGIFVASRQSGADDPSQGVQRDTYFDASYSGRLLTITVSKAFNVINAFVPEADMEFVVVNDDTYGGSGGQVAVASFAAPEIIAHEAQHSFSGLGDEYDYAGVAPWESPNTTMQTNRAVHPLGALDSPGHARSHSGNPGLVHGARSFRGRGLQHHGLVPAQTELPHARKRHSFLRGLFGKHHPLHVWKGFSHGFRVSHAGGDHDLRQRDPTFAHKVQTAVAAFPGDNLDGRRQAGGYGDGRKIRPDPGCRNPYRHRQSGGHHSFGQEG